MLSKNYHLNAVLVEKYQSAKVRHVYEDILDRMTQAFPQYVDELRGMSDGAKVPFFKVIQGYLQNLISHAKNVGDSTLEIQFFSTSS